MGRSYRASKEGLGKAKSAFNTWGKTQDYLAGAGGCSRSTVINFFARRPIDKNKFQVICTELGLEWGEIAELEESESTVESSMNVGLKIKGKNNPGSGTTAQVLLPQTPASEENNSGITYKIIVTLSANLIGKATVEWGGKKIGIQTILNYLKKFIEDITLEIDKIEKGSVKITFNGTWESLQRLKILFDEGRLREILGIPVENVELLTTEDTEEDDDYKLQLIERIIAGEDLGNDLVGADLSGAFLSRAILEGANLVEANLEGANLVEADLRRADLGEANLEGADLEGANLVEANLEGANLVEADLRGADLGEANLERAYLEGANLRGAYLGEADLRGADLRRADLVKANLMEANLEGANLVEANLENATVKDALFQSSTGITEEMKRELESRGAIFGDKPPVSNSLLGVR